MIAITIYRDHAGRYTRLYCIGHAGYASSGEDIVCAGVSALVLNTVNAIEAFTQEQFEAKTDRDSGLIDITFRSPTGHDGKLLLDAMVLGLQDIQDKYGKEYSFLTLKEV